MKALKRFEPILTLREKTNLVMLAHYTDFIPV